MNDPLLDTPKLSTLAKMSKVKTQWDFKSGYQAVLTRYHLIMYGIGSTIGAGIFALTGVAVQYTGPSLWISFLVGGIVQMSTAMTYAELCARFPYNGSAYAYVYATFGEFAAWLVGWNTFMFYGASGSGLARALTAFVHGLLGKFGIQIPVWLFSFPFYGLKLNLLSVIFMVICYFLSITGTHSTATANSGLTIVKLVTLGFIVVMAASQFKSSNMVPHVKEEYGWHGTVHGATIVYFASIGFDFISTISEEAENTQLDAPYSMQFTVIVCTIIYIFVALALTGMGLGQSGEFVAETAMADAF
jgi:APA family basic amino acid/polyamine antiporter